MGELILVFTSDKRGGGGSPFWSSLVIREEGEGTHSGLH